jgi:hypothetical protein
MAGRDDGKGGAVTLGGSAGIGGITRACGPLGDAEAVGVGVGG